MAFNVPRKDSMLARDYRFKSSSTIVPAPNSYMHRSFADVNTFKERGNSFSRSAKLIRKDKKVPGPGVYEQDYNPEKKLSYTMRSKAAKPNNQPVLFCLSRKWDLGSTMFKLTRQLISQRKSVPNIITLKTLFWVVLLGFPKSSTRR